MSDAVTSIGRNDPCHCGSGKKYKKCHYQEDQNKRQAALSPSKLADFLPSNYPAYLWYKGFRVLVNRRDWNLLYETFIEGSPVRERFPSSDDFVAQCRQRATFAPGGGEDYRLRRFRFLGDHVFILSVRGEEDRTTDELEYELIACRGTSEGLRIYDLNRVSVPKPEREEELADPKMESFPVVAAALEAARAQPVVRPFVRRWPIPGAAAVSASVASAAPMGDEIRGGDVSKG